VLNSGINLYKFTKTVQATAAQVIMGQHAQRGHRCPPSVDRILH